MSAKIVDGKAISGRIKEELKGRIERLKKEKGIIPGLAVVLVGEDPASQIYVRNKEKACNELGVNSRIYYKDSATTQEELLTLIHQLNTDVNIHGILVQLPLPSHIDEKEALRAIDVKKDVDGFHAVNAGKLMIGERGFLPCTPKGIIELIHSTNEPIEGKKAVVIGRSNIVGKPVALLLLNENATVTICHSKTKNIGEITREADILVAAVGKPGMVTGEMIKPGAIVIDVGTTRVDGRLRGDVDFQTAEKVAGYITPVPGGVGPMTITMLIANTIEAGEMYG